MQEQSICQNGATITLRTGGQGRTTPSTHKKTNTNAASQMCVFILSTRLSWTEGPTRWTIVSCMLRDSTLSVIIPSVHQSVNRSHSGLILERAREPDALCFALGLSHFVSSEPGGLSLIGMVLKHSSWWSKTIYILSDFFSISHIESYNEWSSYHCII